MIGCGNVVKENFQVGIMIGSGLPIVLIQDCQKQVKYIQVFFLKVNKSFKAEISFSSQKMLFSSSNI